MPGVASRYDRVVRCSAGHLYTTTWVPLASLKALRLGTSRWQRCPVGGHWAMTTQVDTSALDPAELAAARAVHDIRIP